MLGDIIGYIIASKTAKITSVAPDSDFQGQILRVLEFGVDNCALVINNKATALATIEPEDIISSFKCSTQGDVICPPNLSLIDKMMYVQKATSRKGGYNYILRQMITAISLHKGEFDDSLLWSKQ